MIYDAHAIARAKGLGSATLHEAAGRIGALPSSIKPLHPGWKLAGAAFTVHGPAGDNLWIHRAIYAAARGDVLVVFPSGGVEWGYWGDILNTAAVQQQLGGLVIDGGVRDTANLVEMGFPVFSNGVCIRGTGKDLGATAFLNRPVRIGEVIVSAGDLVVGDRDGLVVLPQARVNAVIQRAEAREADEAEKLARIRRGERTIDLYGWGAEPPARG
jgi:4-hydroxy-4-methyl-2-oxoglutarate aldolase